MYKIPANTLFMGKNLVFVPECHSTNTVAHEISRQSSSVEGTLVITNHQTAGKGQRGNVWESAPGKNFTFSLILKPTFLAVNRQYFLNIVVCLALKDYLEEKAPDPVYIKWPNDILVHGKKISGILIENHLQGTAIVHSIVGVGLNMNQKEFAYPHATSLSQICGRHFDLEQELPPLLQAVEGRYLQLRRGEQEAMLQDYLGALFRRMERHTFTHAGGVFEGVIHGLDATGKLLIETNEGFRSFGVKEIQYV